MAERPLIAVTGSDRGVTLAWWATRLQLWLAGARALRLTPSTPPERVHRRFDGLIIGGGSDIDPSLYGGSDDGVAKIDTRRDRFELEIIDRALRTNLPILGICRGAQLINVMRGGSLYGDIRGLRRRTSNRRSILPTKSAIGTVQQELHRILRRTRWRINSLHHQAVERPGKNLDVAARDLDGFVQAIESTDEQYLIGVQWHPEYLPYLAPQRRLFRNLVAKARTAKSEDLEVPADQRRTNEAVKPG